MRFENIDEPNQDLIDKNPFINHIIKNKKSYLTILMMVTLLTPVMVNLLLLNPLITGQESYYHLNIASQSITLKTILYYPLQLSLQHTSLDMLIIFPIILAFGCLMLFLRIGKIIRLPEKFTLFFGAFLILTPSFIKSFTTLSSHSLFLFLFLLGWYLLLHANQLMNYASVIPFTLTTLFFDIITSLLILIFLAVYFYGVRRKKMVSPTIVVSVITALLFIAFFVLNQPFSLGPFQQENLVADFISDLGGQSGIGFFLLVLSIVGVSVTWKKKKFSWAYLFLPLIIPLYVLNTHNIFFLSIIAVFLGTVGFIYIFERTWVLSKLKKFTFLLLILGIVFSTLTYLDRVTIEGPSNHEIADLSWIKENTPTNAVVFTHPDDSYTLKYFAARTPFQEWHLQKKFNPSKTIFDSLYIHELFPILEKNKISYLYLTQAKKENLNQDQGLIFLLQNERFKLVHSSRGGEVWQFMS